MAMPKSPPRPLTISLVASSSSVMQSHSTLPLAVRNNSARWPMAKAGVVPMPIRPGSCWRNVLVYRRASASWVVQTCPDGGTNWRSSSQIGQRAGSLSYGVNCVPQVLQMKAGIGGSDMKNAALASAASCRNEELLEHDPEKWNPVFRKDHAPSKC